MSQNVQGAPAEDTDILASVPHWLGGVGAATILTGLVFFATRAYRGDASTVSRLVTLLTLYVLSALAFALGAWVERRPGLRGGYSLSLMAGALAAACFTTYAAHAVPALRVVGNPWLATALMAVPVAFALAIAKRRREPGLALLAFLLALYADVVAGVSSFTLVSNVVLVAGAFLFAVRNAWSPGAHLFLVATYATFAVRFLLSDGWLAFPGYPSLGTFARAAGLLLVYFSLFAAPVVVSSEAAFTERRRVAFLALNGAFAWTLVGLVLPRSEPRALPAALAVFGMAFLVLGVVIDRRHVAWVYLRDAARTLGLVLLVVAVLTLVGGSSGPLVLALAALAVAMAAESVESVVLRVVTLLVSLLAAALSCLRVEAAAGPAILVGAVLLFTGFWVDRHDERTPRLNAGSLYFSALGLGVWLMVALTHVPVTQRAAVLAFLAVVLTLGAHLIGLAPAAYLSHAFLLAAFVVFMERARVFAGPTWTVIVVVASSLVLAAWWRSRPPAPRLQQVARRALPILYAAATVAVLFVWLHWRVPPRATTAWLVVPVGLATAALLYAVLRGAWAFGILGQVFLLSSVAEFWTRWDDPLWLGGTSPTLPGAWPMLAPLVGLVALAVVLDYRSRESPTTPAAWRWSWAASFVVRALTSVLSVVWVYWYLPPTLQFVALQALAILLLVFYGERADLIGVALSAVLSTGGVWLFWINATGPQGFRLLELVGFTLLLVEQQLWRHRYPHLVPSAIHDPAMVIGIGSLWRWAHLTAAGVLGLPFVVVGWAIVGFLAGALGLLLKEARYRHLGLVILLASLARVFWMDGMTLPAFARLVSVLVLGAAILALGFAYDRLSSLRVRRT